MATYIPGMTDYIPAIQAFQPDYNFLGNVMQTRQGRYDQAYNQTNSLYNSLLNSPMLRDADIKRREELFKAIDGNIKQISGMDLSLQQNQDAAMKIFQPFYDDKNIVNDMVKTKQYYNQLSAAEASKNCTDHDKCGGRYWEPGERKLHYKAEEFRNMSDEDALNFKMPDYDKYYDWQKDAMKLVKDQDLSVTQDIDNGKWIVTKKNGELIQGGLYGLFKATYGNDPRVQTNYETGAFVDRKDFAKNYIANGFASENAAESHYIQDTLNNYDQAFGKRKQQAVQAKENITGSKNALEEERQQKGGLLPADLAILENIVGKEENASNVVKSLDVVNDTVQNPYLMDPESMRTKADKAAAFLRQETDFQGLAKVMSLKDAEFKLKENPYAMANLHADLQLRNSTNMAVINHRDRMIEMGHKAKLDWFADDHKAALKNNTFAKDESTAQVLSGKGYATDFINKDDPTAGYKRQQLLSAQTQAQAQSKDKAFLFELLNHAKDNVEKNPGARNYLENFFGKQWKTIRSEDDMLKALAQNKKSVDRAFNLSLEHLDDTKNPDGNVRWAKDFMAQRSNVIQDIKDDNTAFYGVVAFNLANNKKVASKIQALGGIKGQEVYKDADLIVTTNGFITDEDVPPGEFLVKHMERHSPGVLKLGPNSPAYTKAINDARKAYPVLREKFYDEYNNTPGVSLEQGPGLHGSGAVTANPVRYTDVNPAVLTGAPARAKSIVNDIVRSGNFDVVLGEPTEDNLKTAGSHEDLKPVLNMIRSDLSTAHHKNKVGFFDFEETPIAGSVNKSAMTLYLKPEYVNKYLGDSKSPLHKYKNELMKGITMVYDTNTLTTATTRSGKMSNLELTVKTVGKTYDSYPNAGKVKLTANKATGGYLMEWEAKEFNPNTGTYVTSKTTTPLNSLNKVDATVKALLSQKQFDNKKAEDAFIAQQNNNK